MANGLTDQYQALYDAQLPQLELAARQAQQARGMFYSGNAVDAETKAKADLLAKILAQQASDTQASKEQQAQIDQAQSAQENQTKAQNRATNMGLIGSGVGAGATLLGMKLFNPKGLTNVTPNLFASNAQGQIYNTQTGALANQSGGAGGVGGAALNPPGPTAISVDPGAGAGGLGSLTGTVAPPASLSSLQGPAPLGPEATAIGPHASAGPLDSMGQPASSVSAPGGAAQSMWSNPMGQLGAGLVGGAGGYLAAGAAGAKGTNAAIGSGLGGLLGGALGSSGIGASWGAGNPYAAGAGALIGSFGGGLLGNLFK